MFSINNENLNRELCEKLPRLEDKIKLEGDQTEEIIHTNTIIQEFKKFVYSPTGDFTDISKSVKILVPDDFFESHIANDLKWAIKEYDKLAPTYKSILKEFIMPEDPNRFAGMFRHERPNTIYVFKEYIEYESIIGSRTFIHEATHLMDGVSRTISTGPFKNVFYNHAEEKLSESLYIKFKNVTENRLGYNSFNFLEKRKIRKLFNSDYGRDSWVRYINNDYTFNGTAFSEELADSVGVTITNLVKDRAVDEKIMAWILNNLWV